MSKRRERQRSKRRREAAKQRRAKRAAQRTASSKQPRSDRAETGKLRRLRPASSLWSLLTDREEPGLIRVADRVTILVGTVLLLASAARWLWPQFKEGPVLELAYYSEAEDGNIEITPNQVEFDIQGDQLAAGTFSLPLRFAVRNEGDSVAPITKVEFRTRADISIQLGEGATKKVDPNGQSIVYERQVQPLFPEDEWTIYEEIDEIAIEVFTFESPVATLSSDNVPLLIHTTYYGFKASTREEIPPVGLTEEILPVVVEFFSDDDVVAADTLTIVVPFDIGIRLPYDQAIQEDLDECPKDLDAQLDDLASGTPDRSKFIADYSVTGERIDYLEFTSGGRVGAVLDVDGAHGAASVDLDGDGLIDHRAFWPDTDDEPTCIRFTPQQPLEPWPDDAFEP